MKEGFIKVAAVTPKIRIADVAYNMEQICSYAGQAAGYGSKIIVFPELSLTGYSCGMLFLQESLLNQVKQAVLELKKRTTEMDAIIFVGAPVRFHSKIYNVMIVFNKGRILGIVPKTYLPNYDEFAEMRYFTPAPKEVREVFFAGEPVSFGTKILFETEALEGLVIAAEICADAWTSIPPSAKAVQAGATLIVNGSASNELINKSLLREKTISECSGRQICGYVYSNPGIGDSTESLIFCGHNIIAENGEILESKHCGEEGIVCTEIDIFRLLHERSRNNNFECMDNSDYKVISFNIDVQDTILTRKFDGNPFVSKIPEKKAKQCEQLEQILTLAVIRKIKSGRCKTIQVKGKNIRNILLAFFIIVRAFKFLKIEEKKILVDIKQSQEFPEYDIFQAVIQQLGGSIREGCSGDNVCIIETESFTEYLMEEHKTGTGEDIYALNIGTPQSLLDELLVSYKSKISNSNMEKYLEKFEKSNTWNERAMEEFCIYYVLYMGFSSFKICRMAEAAFGNEFTKQQMILKIEECCSRIEEYSNKIGKLVGPKVLNVSLNPCQGCIIPALNDSKLWERE